MVNWKGEQTHEVMMWQGDFRTFFYSEVLLVYKKVVLLCRFLKIQQIEDECRNCCY